jgi:hypothetical protein
VAYFDFESGTGPQLWRLGIVINGWSTKALSIGLFKRPIQRAGTVQLDENTSKTGAVCAVDKANASSKAALGEHHGDL